MKKKVDLKQIVAITKVPLFFYPWVCSRKKATYRSEIHIFLLLQSYTGSDSVRISLYLPVKMGFILATRQSCVCLGTDSNCVTAEPHTKPNF